MHIEDFMLKPYITKSIRLFVGKNGSGKSRLLRNIANSMRARRQYPIIVCNTPFDIYGRFGNFKKISTKSGSNLPERVLKNAILYCYLHDPSRMASIGSALEYCGYDSSIQLLCNVTDIDFLKSVEREFHASNHPDEFLAEVIYLANLIGTRTNHHINLTGGMYENITNENAIKILRWEKIFLRAGLINSIEVKIERTSDSLLIPLRFASSGELSLISTLVFVATSINRGGVLIIDEPENSLHPQWQKDYIKKIVDLTHLYEPSIYIATHAPIIVSGAKTAELEFEILQLDGETILNIPEDENSLEGTMWNLFETITPHNHYLSERIVSTIASMKRQESSLSEVLNIIDSFDEGAYDPNQSKVFSAARTLAKEVAAEMRDD